MQTVPEEFRDLGDRVLLLGRMQGRGKGSGAQVDAPIANILDFRGGRIWRSRVYFDRAEALRAAGVSGYTPPTPAFKALSPLGVVDHFDRVLGAADTRESRRFGH
jgi:hypothetical protein